MARTGFGITRARSGIALAVATALVCGPAQGVSFASTSTPDAVKFVPAKPKLGVPVAGGSSAAPRRLVPAGGKSAPVPATHWPTTGHFLVQAATGPTTRAGLATGGIQWHSLESGAVSVAAPAAAAGAAAVTIDVLDRPAAGRAGASGPAFTLTRTDGGAQARMTLRLDPHILQGLFGANYPARVQWLQRPVGSPHARPTQVPSAGSGAQLELRPLVSSTPSMLMATSTTTASNGAGSFAATSLSAASSWDVSAQTGSFAWNYPMGGVPAAAGPEPELGLSYSSQSVDGETGSTNNQPSNVGDGWDLAGTGYIERSYLPCSSDGQAGSGDLCWKNYNATISFGGHSDRIITDASTGVSRLQSDDGSRIERLTGAGNHANGGEYWKMTTLDGTQYFFGLNQLPGWTTGKAETQSAWTVPVAGNNNGEPCHGASFATSFCPDMAWRWNLDYVVDPHDNSEAFYYSPETNQYQQAGTSAVSYIRGGSLSRVDYGTIRGAELSASAPQRMLLDYGNRCDPNTTCGATDPAAWPDVPLDQQCPGATGCATNTSPAFFTTRMLAKVHSQLLSGGTYSDVDSWTLAHSFPNPNDTTSAALWLDQVTHKGYVGGTPITLAPVVFHKTAMLNRIFGGNALAPLTKFRISSIDTESGASIAVTYTPQECTASMVPTLNQSPQSNNHRCFPQWWTPQTTPPGDPILDWFNSYAVAAVSSDPRTGGSDDAVQQTYYDYTGTPAWRYDTSPATPADKRTWSSYAGYNKVRISQGDTNSPTLRASTDYLYYQGKDGDNGAPAGGVYITASDNSTSLDSRWLAGRVREKIDTVGVGGAVVERTMTTAWASAPTANDGTETARLVDDGDVLTTTTLSAGGVRTTETKTGYDSSDGLPTSVNGLGDTSTAADDRCTRTSYADNTSGWLREFPAEVSVVAKACTVTPTLPADAISDTRYTYDTDSSGHNPAKGDLLTTEVVKSYTGSTPNWLTTASSTYDSLGRTLVTTDTRTGVSRTTSTAYTPAAGGPVTKTVTTRGPMNWSSTTTYDPARQSVLTTVDQNGHTTEATYDALGRRTQVWAPDHLRTAFPTVPSQSYAYVVQTAGPNSIAATTLTPSGGQVTRNTLYDGLLRPRQTQAPAEGGGRDLTDTFYDAAGNAYLTSSDYYATGTPDPTTLFVPSLTVPSQTKVLYDGAGRRRAELLLANGSEKWRTSYAYGGDHVDVTPPAGGTATTTYTDARGNPTALLQYHGGTPTGIANTGDYDKTSYSYWPAGQMKTMTDPHADVWSWTYDVLGRLISSSDPDRGTTTSAYNDANQLTSTTDVLGNTLVYTYDNLDRKTAEYKTSIDPANEKAAWSYDPTFVVGGVTTQARGQLGSSTRYTAGATGPAFINAITGYDAADRPTGRIVTIPAGYGPLTDSYSYTMAYGADGSPTLQGVPGKGGLPAESLTIGYDSLGAPGGLHSSSGSYVVAVTYDHLGRLAQTIQDQSSATLYRTYTYDDGTNRLIELLSQRSATTNAVIADRKYTYTDAGDLSSISDNTPATGVDTQCFSYDGKQQLTAAWTPATTSCAAPTASSTFSGPAPYWQSYTYDTIGNRTSITRHATTSTGTTKTDTYAYPALGQPQPHTVRTITHTGGTTPDTYTYDLAGNTLTTPTTTYTYDLEGHQKTALVGTQSLSDIYDADGNRLLHIDATGTTLYLGDMELHANPNATAASGVRTYTSADGRQVAERTTTAGVTGSRLSFLDTDQHGTATATLDTATNTPTRRHLDPFGGNRDATTPSWIDNHGYLNKPTDTPTATTHLGAREYSSALGRFLSVDPLLDPADPLQTGGYSYAANNPITKSDPTGLRPAGDSGPLDREDARDWARSQNRATTVAARKHAVATAQRAYDRERDHVQRAMQAEVLFATALVTAASCGSSAFSHGGAGCGFFRSSSDQLIDRQSRNVERNKTRAYNQQLQGTRQAVELHTAEKELQDATAAETATGAVPRFITNAAGDTLDTTRITIPEGKFDYLLKGSSKSGVFSDSMGFDQASLDSALRSHLVDNFGGASESAPMTGGGMKFTVRGPMIGPSDQSWNITTAWGVDLNGTVRLITATP